MATSGLGAARRAGTRGGARRIGGVPVFLYHGLLEDGVATPGGSDLRYALRESTFRMQLAALQADGHTTAVLHEAWARGAEAAAGHRRPAILTFDDGRISDFEVAFPLLLQAGARAEFFVNTATVGGAGYLSWGQIRAMHAAGMSFQSHGHDHVILLGLPPSTLRRQLWDSRRLLEDGLGAAVHYLAAPYGLVSRRVVMAALEAGYRAVCTSGEWMARPGARTVSRLTVYSTTTLLEFRQLLYGMAGLLTRRRLRVGLAYMPKRVLLRLRRRWLERDV